MAKNKKSAVRHSERKTRRAKKKNSFFDLKPWDWGPGTENASEEIDEVLYGGKS